MLGLQPNLYFTDKIPTKNILDVLTKEKADAILSFQRTRNFAVRDQEVLIKGAIPAKSILNFV